LECHVTLTFYFTPKWHRRRKSRFFAMFDRNRSTYQISLCALDLSNGFDKVNDFVLHNKLMNGAVPIMLLIITLEHCYRSFIQHASAWISSISVLILRMWRPSGRYFITSVFQYICIYIYIFFIWMTQSKCYQIVNIVVI